MIGVDGRRVRRESIMSRKEKSEEDECVWGGVHVEVGAYIFNSYVI